MAVRFFNDMGGPADVDGGKRLLIGIEHPTDSPGDRHEAVRPATEEDLTTYAEAYAAYEAAEAEKVEAAAAATAEQDKAAAEQKKAEAEAAKKAEEQRQAEERSSRRGH